jgi:cell division protein FtsB
MSLDGLRAWIGEVERKLGMRTRVFLALTVIAIGIGGAAIYLAIDARDSSVSQSDVQALQERFEARIGAGGSGAAGTEVAQLEAELKALQAEVATLKGEEKSGAGSGGGVGTEPLGGASGGVTGGMPSAAKLQELLQQAKEKSREAE